MVIGTDRLELYEYFARRRDVINANNRSLLKLGVALTVAHAIIIRVPTYASYYFGDEVSEAEKKLGAED